MDFAGLDIFAISIKMGKLTAMGGKASPRLRALMQFVFEQ